MVFAYISVFIGLAVMLGIGTLILSGSVMDCEQISWLFFRIRIPT